MRGAPRSGPRDAAGGEQVLARLGVDEAEGTGRPSSSIGSSARRGPFAGRHGELTRLSRALEAVGKGRAAVTLFERRSEIGLVGTVIDVETGKLLEKFRFGPGGASSDNEELLQNYYDSLAACQAQMEIDPTYVCPSWEGVFSSDG